MQRRRWIGSPSSKACSYLVPWVWFSCYASYLPVIPVIRREKMLKKQLTLLFALVLTFPLAAVVFGQKAAKEARWEGRVETTSKEHSTLTVRKVGGSIQKTCEYDGSTKWVSQYHGEKKVNDIDASQVKDGDY